MNPSPVVMPLISVIMAIHGNHPYLGHCLNSLLSQTYTCFEVIMTTNDSSLTICKQYAALDSRFKLLSSSSIHAKKAKELAIAQAKGDYFFFLDCDDILNANALQTLMSLELEHHTGFVSGYAQPAVFGSNQKLPASGFPDWKPSKTYYSRDEFAANRMYLFYHTHFLLNSRTILYNANIWRKQRIHLPDMPSPYDGFAANIDFLPYCSGVAFARDALVYHNAAEIDASASPAFHPKQFKAQLSLLTRFAADSRYTSKRSPTEERYYAEYVVWSGLNAIQTILDDNHHFSSRKKQKYINSILRHRLFKASIKSVSIPSEYDAWKPFIVKQNAKLLIEHVKEKQQHMNPTVKSAKPRSFVNKMVGKCFLLCGKVLSRTKYGAKFIRLEKNLHEKGLKWLWNAHLSPFSKSYRLQEQHTQMLQKQISDLRRKIESQHKLEYINELRQKKKILIIGSAEHTNIGDAAITLAEQNLLFKQYPEYFQIEFSTYQIDQQYEFLQAIVNSQDMFFIHGGGNIGDRYLIEEKLHRRIISDFPEHKMIILPQTISFGPDENGLKQLEISKQIYNRHQDLTIFTRGRSSFAFAKEHFFNARVELMPDLVFALQRDYHFDRSGILLCLRTDQEGILCAQDKESIRRMAAEFCEDVEETTNMDEALIGRERRAAVVNEELKRFAKKKVVITDRLHGMIFAAITSTPVIVIDSVDHKIGEFYQEFFSDSNAIFYIKSELGQIEEKLKCALTATDPVYPVFEKKITENLRSRISEN